MSGISEVTNPNQPQYVRIQDAHHKEIRLNSVARNAFRTIMPMNRPVQQEEKGEKAGSLSEAALAAQQFAKQLRLAETLAQLQKIKNAKEQPVQATELLLSQTLEQLQKVRDEKEQLLQAAEVRIAVYTKELEETTKRLTMCIQTVEEECAAAILRAPESSTLIKKQETNCKEQIINEFQDHLDGLKQLISADEEFLQRYKAS